MKFWSVIIIFICGDLAFASKHYLSPFEWNIHLGGKPIKDPLDTMWRDITTAQRDDDVQHKTTFEIEKQEDIVALVSANFFKFSEDIQLRSRFMNSYFVADKDGTKYEAYVGRQFADQIEESDILSAVYGQFAHPEKKKKDSA